MQAAMKQSIRKKLADEIYDRVSSSTLNPMLRSLTIKQELDARHFFNSQKAKIIRGLLKKIKSTARTRSNHRKAAVRAGAR